MGLGPEAKIEKTIVEWAEECGGMALKLKIEGLRDFPDRTLLLWGGVIVFVEVKTATGQPSKGQEIMLAKLRRLGFVAGIARHLNDAKQLVHEFKMKQQRDCEGDAY